MINPNLMTIGLSAFTALAAHQIGGTTIHSLLGISFGSNVSKTNRMSASLLSKYRYSLQQLKVLIIDEISFVGANLLAAINQRLQEIMGVDKPFGGVLVLCFGDLYQLQPVKDLNVFQTPSGSYSELTGSVWNEFAYFYLEEIMRQDNLSWCQLLGRLRVNMLTDEDIERLEALINSPVPKGTLRACRLNAHVDQHNASALQQHCNRKYCVQALDSVEGEQSDDPNTTEKFLDRAKTLPVDKTHCLRYEITVTTGLPYMIVCNIDKG